MKIAIMQPYFFPYIGYFQLVNAVDVFVLYDDVNFIKQGWINRNKILNAGSAMMFSIPLKNASSFKLINETEINNELYDKWRNKFMRTLEQAYGKAPFFNEIYKLICNILNSDNVLISEIANNSIITVSNYLGLVTKFKLSSDSYSETNSMNKETRLIEIVKRNNANIYINPIGGAELYTKESFLKKDIELNFIKSKQIVYKQFDKQFLPWLSVIDVLMFNNIEEIKVILNQYELV